MSDYIICFADPIPLQAPQASFAPTVESPCIDRRGLLSRDEEHSIIANSECFDADRLDDYRRIDRYAVLNKCTFEEAMRAMGAM